MGFESNQLPANAPIEDRRSAATCLQTRGMLLGVFDGHAGCACAQVQLTLLSCATCHDNLVFNLLLFRGFVPRLKTNNSVQVIFIE